MSSQSDDGTDATVSDSDTDEEEPTASRPDIAVEIDSSGDDVSNKPTSDDAVSALLHAAAVAAASNAATSADENKTQRNRSELPASETTSESLSEQASTEAATNGGSDNVALAEDGEAATERMMSKGIDDLRDEKQEQHYSTRGRDRHSKDEEVRTAPEEPPEKEINSSIAASSFLEDLTSHERLTRTRFLPDVDGIHVLRKSEVRSDLVLARAVESSSGTTSQISSKRSRKYKPSSGFGRDDDQMDGGDDVSGDGPSDEEMEEDSAHTANLEYSSSVASKAFLAPLDKSNGDGMDGKRGQLARPPHVVEAVTAYNPPRPPESVGPKKKHRMLRWERKPQDVETDLSNYRKTVQRTREELHNAEHERERIESVGFALQNSFLAQIKALNVEGRELNAELGRIVQKCVQSADLASSRTRIRGRGKGCHIMKDVLTILKALGGDPTDMYAPLDTTTATTKVKIPTGIGGVSAQSFVDWIQSTKYIPEEIARAWTLPGDRVDTPYGEGTVLNVYGPSGLDVTKSLLSDFTLKPTQQTSNLKPTFPRKFGVDVTKSDPTHGFGTPESVAPKAAIGEVQPNKMNTSPEEISSDTPAITAELKKTVGSKNDVKVAPFTDVTKKDASTEEDVITPRVSVQLPFGIGFFPVNVTYSKEDPTSYSDAMLALRWKKMIETALPVGSCLDVAIMETIGSESHKHKFTDGDVMNIEDETECSQSGDCTVTEGQNGGFTNPAALKRFVPFASGVLPTFIGRGGVVADVEISALESAMKKSVYEGYGNLGTKQNQGLPQGFREWEDSKCELSLLRATMLQKRNELNRQRRIRQFNEMTLASTSERSLRMEALVHEMRTDLKSLKDRLDDELVELQLDSELSENLLSSYYQAQEKPTFCITDATPPKRRRAGNEVHGSLSPSWRVPVDAAAADVNTEEEDDDDDQLEAVPVGTSLIQTLEDDDKDRPNKRARPSAQ